MRIKSLLLLFLVPAVIVSLAMLTLLSYLNAGKQAENLASMQASNIALEQSDRIFSIFRNAESAVLSLASSIGELRKGDNPQRDALRQIIKGGALASKDYFGVWTLWESNTFDNKDSEFVGNEDYGNKYGQANAYWSWSDGALMFEASDNYATEEYYTKPMSKKGLSIIPPYRDPDTANCVLMTSIAMPIMDNGAALGVVGIDIELEFIHKIVSEVKPFGSGFAMLVSDQGAIVAQPENMASSGTELPTVSRDVMENMKKGSFFSMPIKDKSGASYQAYYTPLKLDSFEAPWFFMVALPLDAVMAESRRALLIQVGIGLVALLALVGIVFYTAGVVSRPLRRISDLASDVAQGKNIRDDVRQEKILEVATLQKSLHTMLDSLQGSMAEAQKRTEEAAHEAKRAHEAMAEAQKAQERSEQGRKAMLEIAARVDAVSNQLQDTSQQLSTSIAVAGRQTSEQGVLMAETVTAIAGMSDSIARVSRNTDDTARFSEQTGEKALSGAEVVNSTIAAFNSIKTETDALAEQIEDLSKRTDGIGSILAIINDIADQTNLLALNAAIEAARAGDAGRGFAVVADEVRKLAEKTMQATQQVEESVAGIRQSMKVSANGVHRASRTVDDTVALGTEAKNSLTDIVDLVRRMNDQIQDIAHLCREQSVAGEQVASTVDRLRQLSIAVGEAMDEGAAVTRSLEPQARELGLLVQQLSTKE